MFLGLSEKGEARQVVKGGKRATIDPKWRVFLQAG